VTPLDTTATALAVDAARTRCRLEVELLGAILCRPADLLGVANDAGVSPDIFAFPDLRTIYAAACHSRARGYDPDDLPGAVAYLLRRQGCWRGTDPTRQLGDMLNSQFWSVRMVWAIFHQNFPAAPNVRRAVRAMTNHVRDTRDAGEHLAHAVNLLNGDAPAVGPVDLGLHLVRLSRLTEIPVESLAEFMDETDEHQRRVA
jgi:hypothetical protein